MNHTTRIKPLDRNPVSSWIRPCFIVGSLIMAMIGIQTPGTYAFETRTIDGKNNNVENPTWGSIDTQLLRYAAPDYQDHIAKPSGENRPNVREISNTVVAQDDQIFNEKQASDFIWQWGQFIDHDITLSDESRPAEPFPIHVPTGDPYFDPQATGLERIMLNRSVYDLTTGTTPDNPRQQINQITAYIDASMVYGSDSVRAGALRTLDGTGQLTTSPGNLLPFNTMGLPNLGGPNPSLFIAGDIRANEQVGLTSMHTLFMREHNRVAARIHHRFPQLGDDAIYEAARAWVGAVIQVITYQEFLPMLLGPDALQPYTGYKREVNPGIATEFSTAAYRVGHTLLSPVLLRLQQNGQPIPEGNLPLREAFLVPWRLTNEGGIEPVLRGLATNRAQEIDTYVIDDVRNFLFGPPGSGGFDLASLNLQRGRDHGIPSYNDVRLALGLTPALTFADITSEPEVQQHLKAVYGQVELVDLWIGALAEDHRPGAMVGELIYTILVDQFERLRDGDRFFYLNAFPHYQIRILEATTLADVIRRNTTIGREIQNNVFLVPHKHHDHHHGRR
ncbi:MAG: peroxiredoxin [Nitrospirota bacterium]|nr:peroxiredoxin [Nitrospirota bacterium]MDH5585517.1 peroxiredoxin [Nitrospirota bacterium]MDH5773616.1 peroxiredoxin [Nitrospirota bacterium]